MLPSLPITPPRRPGARRRLRRRALPTLGLMAAVGFLTVASCTDAPITGAPLGSATAVALSPGASIAASSAPLGIGGSYTLTAGGIAVSGVPPAPTGIVIPAGIPVRVEVSGVITRTQTAGLQEFCALPRWQPSCAGAWASIIAETPIGPSGLDFWPGRAAALVAWAGGTAASPEPGSTSLSGTSGGELQFGRTGWGCYYSDTEDDLSGNCFTFGGDFTVTVRADPGSDPDGDGIPDALDPDDDGDGIPDGEDEDHGGAEDPSWLTAAVESSVPVGGSTDATVVAKYREGASVSDFVWSFVPDVVSTVSGDTVAEMETAKVIAAVRGEPSAAASSSPPRVVERRDRPRAPRRGTRAELPPGIERIDATHVRLPDGRIVGPGLHLYEIPAPAEQRSAQRSLRKFGGTTPLPAKSMTTSASGAMSLSSCDAMSVCGAFVPATRGTFVVTAMVDGKPRSASARLESAGQAKPTLTFTCSAAALPRGDPVTCTAKVSAEAAFRVISVGARLGEDGRSLPLVTSPVAVAPGKPFTIEGPAVVASQVLLAAEVQQPNGAYVLEPVEDARFTVNPRPWEMAREYDFNPVIREVTHTGKSLGSPYFITGAFAVTTFELLESRHVQVTTARSGPNAGISYVVTEPVLPKARTYLNPQLYAGQWHDDQNGGADPNSGRPRCTADLVPTLVSNILQHEAQHVGIEHHLSGQAVRLIEALAVYQDEAAVRGDAAVIWRVFHRDVSRPTALRFDESDRENWLVKPYPCAWDMNYLDK